MRTWFLGLAVMLGCGGVALGQAAPSGKQQQQAIQPGIGGVPVITNDPAMAKAEQQREQMVVDERRKKIVSDAEKLLRLATELKVDVDKSTKNELSMDVIKKAAEIEKLAHEVKERMRN